MIIKIEGYPRRLFVIAIFAYAVIIMFVGSILLITRPPKFTLKNVEIYGISSFDEESYSIKIKSDDVNFHLDSPYSIIKILKNERQYLLHVRSFENLYLIPKTQIDKIGISNGYFGQLISNTYSDNNLFTEILKLR